MTTESHTTTTVNINFIIRGLRASGILSNERFLNMDAIKDEIENIVVDGILNHQTPLGASVGARILELFVPDSLVDEIRSNTWFELTLSVNRLVENAGYPKWDE